jgi:hypothetical protein
MCILIVVGVFGLLSLSYAQEDVRKQLAEELLLLMEVDKNIEKTFGMMKQMQMEQVKNIGLPKELSKEDSEKIASMQGNIMDIMVKEWGWDKLKEDFIDIYATVFTKEELEGIIAFYKTPVGQKFIKKQPELMQKFMEISQKQMATIMPKIQKAIQDMKETLKESGGKSQE